MAVNISMVIKGIVIANIMTLTLEVPNPSAAVYPPGQGGYAGYPPPAGQQPVPGAVYPPGQPVYPPGQPVPQPASGKFQGCSRNIRYKVEIR